MTSQGGQEPQGGVIRLHQHDLDVHVYRITAEQLDSLYDAGNGVIIYLSLAMGLFGTLVTQIAVYATGISNDSHLANWLPAITVSNSILFFFFAAMSVKNYFQRRKAFESIKGTSSDIAVG